MGKTALLVLDMQNDIIHPDGVIGRTGFADTVASRNIIPNTRRVVDAFRAADLPVVFVRIAFRKDYLDTLSQAPRVKWIQSEGGVVEGSWGAEFHEELQPLPEELVLKKCAVNPFYSTNLLIWLLRHGVDSIVLCGVHTHMVVNSTARAGDDAGLRVYVVEDCCASPEADIHEFEIGRILPLFASIVSSDEMIRSIGSGAS